MLYAIAHWHSCFYRHDCHLDYTRQVVPVGGRFVAAQKLQTLLSIHTWCPQDLTAALQSHTQLQQLPHTDGRYKHLHTQIGNLPLTQQYEEIELYVNSDMKAYWGSAPAGELSEEEWTPALTQLLLQHDVSHIEIWIDKSE